MTSPLEGQPPQQSAQPPRVCSPIASVVTVRVVDAAGKPVSGVTVRITRVRDKLSLGTSGEMGTGSGEFAVLESSALRWLAADGDRIEVAVSKGDKATKAELLIGRDSTTCRIARLSGPEIIVLK
jgi:hypothetical protein